jgi:uncharacterized membrane protein (DUF4010 family)
MPDALSPLITPYLLSLLVATGIGLIIGLEREFRKIPEKDHLAGIRTFPLVSILGCTTTYIALSISPWVLVGASFAFILFVSTTFYVRASPGHSGITTEISLIITFALGAMSSLQLTKEALAAAVITTTLLSLKGQFHTFISKITEDELFAFIKFIVLAMLLFPFLPDTHYGPDGIVNPQEIGLIVVIVSSLSFVGYLLVKFSGTQKGILLTAFFGGLFSSTAVTWVFSSRSHTPGSPHADLYAAGITLASSIMFLRVALVTLIFNKTLFLAVLGPCIVMSVTGFGFAFFLARNTKKIEATSEVELGNPVNILNAFGFGLLYVCISFLVLYANEYMGNKGLVLSGLISGLADVDAITISMSKFAGVAEKITVSALVIIVAAISNTLIKIIISSVKGSRELKRKVSLSLGVTILTGALYILVWL